MKTVFSLLILFSTFTSTLAQQFDNAYWDVNAPVNAMSRTNDTLYIGGSFTFAGPVTGAAVPFNKYSGSLLPAYSKLDKVVKAIIEGPNHEWYVSGYRSTSGPPNSCNPTQAFVTRIKSDFTIDSAFNLSSPRSNYVGICALAIWNNYLFVGGEFDSINNFPRKNIAAFDLSTNSVLSFDPSPNGVINCLLVEGNKLYIGGDFDTISGQLQRALITYDLNTLSQIAGPVYSTFESVTALKIKDSILYVGCLTDSIVFPITIGNRKVLKYNTSSLQLLTQHIITATSYGPGETIASIDIDGDSVFIAGNFYMIDSVPRRGIAAFLSSTDQLIQFNPFTTDTSYYFLLSDIKINEHKLYMGGRFINVEGNDRNNVASYDLQTNQVTPWNPGTGEVVYTLCINDSTVFIGGNFTISTGESRHGLAAFNLSSKTLLPWHVHVTNTLSGVEINSLKISDRKLFLGGRFDKVNNLPHVSLASVYLDSNAVTNLNSTVENYVNSLDVDSNRVFFVGNFGDVNGVPRKGIACVDKTTGNVLNWNPLPHYQIFNQTSNSIKLIENQVYICGDFDSLGGQKRLGLASVDPNTAAVSSWNPCDQNSYASSMKMACLNNRLFFPGHSFMVGGQNVYGCVAVDINTGAFDSINFRLPVNTFASTVSFLGERIFIGGELNDAPAGVTSSIMISADTLNGDTIPGLFFEQHICNWAYEIMADTSRIFLGGLFNYGLPVAEGHHEHFLVYDAGQILLHSEDQENPADIYFYPNPFSERSTLHVGRSNWKNNRLDIYDIFGRKMRSQEINSTEVSFEKRNLIPGIYFYSVSMRGNKIASGKIIIE